VPHRDQALLIFRPHVELFDRRRDGALFIGRLDHADKRRRRPLEATDFPGTLFRTLTLTAHTLNIGLFPTLRPPFRRAVADRGYWPLSEVTGPF
jgi:hypothetical protein